MSTMPATSSAPLVRIGELARRTRVSVSLLRRLADEGLITVHRVRDGRHRFFDPETAIPEVRRVLSVVTPRLG